MQEINEDFFLTEDFPAHSISCEKLYKEILDSLPAAAGIVRLCSSGLKALYLNRCFYKTVGYTKEQYSRYVDNMILMFFKSEQDNITALLSETQPEKEIDFTYRAYRPDNSICWLHITAVKKNLIQNGEPVFLISAYDVSDQKAAEYSLSIRNERYRIFEETSQEVLFVYRVESDYMTFSYNHNNEIHHNEIPRYSEFLKTNPLVHPSDINMFTQTLAEACQFVSKGSIEYRSLIIDPSHYLWCRTFYSSVAGPDGNVSEVFGKITDIDDEIKKYKNMVKLVEFDSLTQIYNKSAAFEKIEYMLNQGYSNVCFAVIDIDNFKQFNDLYGHINGDEVLNTTAFLLKSYFPEAIIGRFGGDEFIVFIRDYKKPDITCEFESLTNNAYLNVGNEEKIKISYSIGIVCTENVLTITELFSEADSIMYDAKKNGKNCIICKNI